MSQGKLQCDAVVWRKDTYRVARGRGFRMHYERGQCSRRATHGDLCRQHAKLTGHVPRWTARCLRASAADRRT